MASTRWQRPAMGWKRTDSSPDSGLVDYGAWPTRCRVEAISTAMRTNSLSMVVRWSEGTRLKMRLTEGPGTRASTWRLSPVACAAAVCAQRE